MPATTCAFVTTRPRFATQPDPSTPSPHATPVTRTTLFDAARRRDPSRAPCPAGRRSPADQEDADRIDALELFQQALGRNDVVDLGEDQRSLHRAPELGLARQVEKHGADRPAQEDAGNEAERETGKPIQQPHAGDDADARPEHPRQHPGETAHERAEEDRAAERHDRDVRRPVAQDQWRDARAEVRADSEARERERPAQEPRCDPVQPSDSDDGDDDPVRGGHVHVSYVAQPPIPAARLHSAGPGGVVQLVRTPACHAGGRGFESRRSRPRKPPLTRGFRV